MKIKIVRQMCLSAALILALTTTACSPARNKSIDGSAGDMFSENIELQNSDTEVETKNSETVSDSILQPTDTPKGEKGTGQPAPVASIEVPIYTINQNTQEVESVVALVPENSELTPELIVDLVIDSFDDRLISVGIENVTTDKDTVIVSFLNDYAPLINVGSGVETTILDAIAQSLVDNLKDEYPKVIFRVEGKEYSSGHYLFGLNEVYLDGTKTK
ncbi:hypothetical protein acsn021_26860 [Anaerocolumna cellulosilytica]|uniref:Uncharacterized protein n=1 Tax=Anaerocolumna cellulosilytica TaxID=433286 RepID=A0A6S6R4W7_9FIRM|nr:hypothetical protein [Anaerocolumna cellulosilytica]MBB5197592.1 hypothetical protein [Anaerocolumna cellulosilytica]BCJ95117.1 hypothetical protein acsn021_26860 [Anaerocolumna cellulosilytica]